MAFTPTWGTGFESGSIEIFASADKNAQVSINTNATYIKTGSYSLRLTSGNYAVAWVRVPHAGTTLDMSAWVYPHNLTYISLQAVLGDGKVVEVRHDIATSRWNAWVDGAKVADGTAVGASLAFQHVQVRFNIANSGSIQSKIDGISDLDYSGDTLPGSDTIAYARIYADSSSTGYDQPHYVDDVTVGTDGWPGDIRFDGLVPDGDSSVEWTPSTGGDNYALVDEIPPSDTDYVSTSGSGFKDLYTLTDWNGTAKTPQFLVQWARAKKDSAGTRQIQFVVSNSGAEDAGAFFDLGIAYAYYSRILITSGSDPWTDELIDSLLIGQNSN